MTLGAKERDRRARLSAWAGVLGRGLVFAATVVTVPLAVSYLGPERYGMWVTVASLMALLQFTDLGIGNGLLNAATRAFAVGDLADARRQIASGLGVMLAAAALVAALFVLVFPLISWHVLFRVSSVAAISEAPVVVAVAFPCVLVAQLVSIATQVRLARQEGYLVHLAAGVGAVGSVVGVGLAIATDQGVAGLVAGFFLPPTLAVAANGLALLRDSGRALRPSRRDASLPIGLGLLRSGLPFFAIQVAMAVAFTSDVLIVTQLRGPEAAAEYGVTARLFAIPLGVTSVALSPLWPAYGDAIARGDIDWVRSTLFRSLRVSLGVVVPVAAVLAISGSALIDLWVGETVRPPLALILGFAAWIVLSAMGTAVAMLLNGSGQVRLQAIAALVMAAANVTLSIFLTQRVGVAGVIWGTVLSYAALVLLPMVIYVPRVIASVERRASAAQ